MNQNTRVIFLSICVLLASCSSANSKQPKSETPATVESKTVASSPTIASTATLNSTVTPTVFSTSLPTLTSTAILTAPTMTLTFTPSSQTVGDLNCVNSAFEKDVTIPDGTELEPGDVFKKTWRLKNTGTCAWKKDFSISFISGVSMSGETTLLDKFVAPGKSANITVEMTAPDVEGTFTGYWTLTNENNVGFGQLVYVQVIVTTEDDDE